MAPPTPPQRATTGLPRSDVVRCALIGTCPVRAAGPAPTPGAPPRRTCRPRTTHDGQAFGRLPHQQATRAAAISSATAISVTCIGRPNRSGAPIRSSSDGRPAAPSATPTTPLRQGRPKLSLMTTPTSTPKRGVEARFQRRRRTVGIARQQQHALLAIGVLDIGLVDAGIGHHEAEAVRHDQDIAADACTTSVGFRQDHFDIARVLAGLGRRGSRLLGKGARLASST